MMPQFEQVRDRARLPTDLVVGLSFIGFGLFKKVIMADSLALIVDPVFDAAARGEQIRTVDALLGTFGFSFQIYFDFSGYSDMAIGSARLFGIRLPENFRSPYKSRSMIEMWRRWHMTLSRFLRDYLYIGLGGNRHGVFRRYRNLMLTMLLGGLWHGAAWTFVLWGGLHGMYLCVNHAWRTLVVRAGLQTLASAPVLQPLFLLVTFTAWAIAFVLFRATDVGVAWSIIHSGFLDFSTQGGALLNGVLADSMVREASLWAGVSLPGYAEIYLLVAASAAICWLLPCTQELMADYSPVLVADNAPLRPGSFRWKPGFRYAALTAGLITVSILNLSTISRFIYFQF